MPDAAVPDLVRSERDVLIHYLDKNRAAVVRTMEGLDEQQRRLAGVPSGTSILGIVQHLTGVETHWFEFVFLDSGRVVSDSMQVDDGVPSQQVVDAYRAACAHSNDIVRACPDLSTRAAIVNPGEDAFDSLRVIIAHMIEETARHTGQADILRERLDGSTDD